MCPTDKIITKNNFDNMFGTINIKMKFFEIENYILKELQMYSIKLIDFSKYTKNITDTQISMVKVNKLQPKKLYQTLHMKLVD